MKEYNTKTTIIPVYRDGHYDRSYMIKIKTKALLKEKWEAMNHRMELMFLDPA